MDEIGKSISLLLAFAALAFSPCVLSRVTPKQPPPEAAGTHAAVVDSRLPTSQEKWTLTSVPDSYFGISGARGSFIAGLLLGAIGAAGNAAHVQAANGARAERVKAITALNLAQILRQSESDLAAEVPLNSSHYTLIPAGDLAFASDDAFHIRCTLNAEFTASAGSKPGHIWLARYVAQPEELIQVEGDKSTQRASQVLSDCLHEAYRLFLRHVTGTLGTLAVHKVVMDPSLTLPVAEAELPDRVIGVDETGVVEFRRSLVREVK